MSVVVNLSNSQSQSSHTLVLSQTGGNHSANSLFPLSFTDSLNSQSFLPSHHPSILPSRDFPCQRDIALRFFCCKTLTLFPLHSPSFFSSRSLARISPMINLQLLHQRLIVIFSFSSSWGLTQIPTRTEAWISGALDFSKFRHIAYTRHTRTMMHFKATPFQLFEDEDTRCLWTTHASGLMHWRHATWIVAWSNNLCVV